MIWGLNKCSLCLVFALLKPIVKVPKIVVARLALFEVIEIAKPIVIAICCRVVAKVVVLLFKLVVGFRYGIGGFITRIYGRPGVFC